MYLLEVHPGLFRDPFQLEAAQHQGWTLITPCTADLAANDANGRRIAHTLSDVVEICPFLLDAAEFTHDSYLKFLALMHTMTTVAQSGHDLQVVMKDKVHKAGDVSIKRASGKHEIHPIIQFGKKTTIVRVHTFTSRIGRKIVFISHTFEKPKNSDRTPMKEQNKSKLNLEAYFNAVDAKTARLIDSQGGHNEFFTLV